MTLTLIDGAARGFAISAAWLDQVGFENLGDRHRVWLPDDVASSSTYLQILPPDEPGGAWHGELANIADGIETIVGIPRPLWQQSAVLLLVSACGGAMLNPYAVSQSAIRDGAPC